MIIIMLIQLLFLLLILSTFKYRNNIWYVLLVLGTIIPILGLIANSTVIIVGYCDVFSSYRSTIIIRDTKLNRWLYAEYFNQNKK